MCQSITGVAFVLAYERNGTVARYVGQASTRRVEIDSSLLLQNRRLGLC